MRNLCGVVVIVALLFHFLARGGFAEELLVLKGERAEVVCAAAGGAIVSFRLSGESLNPLNWEVPADLVTRDTKPGAPRGHFLCLDRWGAPSPAELKNGVPFHGEAPYARWNLGTAEKRSEQWISAEMRCELPLAGLRISRVLELDTAGTTFKVVETVTNTARLGRVYNMVQHPTIAPPFLDEQTLVDTNAFEGFSQDDPPPLYKRNELQPKTGSPWPRMRLLKKDVDLRRLETGTEKEAISDVTSFVFHDDAELGWVVASNPGKKLLLGYVWSTRDYPWLNLWRFRQGEQRLARGLEFGTTGYHQPFPVLVKTGRILDRGTYDYLDAGETTSRSYLCFLTPIPEDFAGVAQLSIQAGRLELRERRDQQPRTIGIPTSLSVSPQ